MTSIGILGGTGAQGRGLARRLSEAGHEVVIGSRSLERARATADAYSANRGGVRGGSNQDAAAAAQEAQQILPDSIVIAAFHHISAIHLDDPSIDAVPGHVLVLGEDRAAVELVCELANDVTEAGGLYAGRLRNAGQVEAFTANLIAINRRYRTHAAIEITGVR